MHLEEFIAKKLTEVNATKQSFMQLIQRLLAYQVIFRRSSQIEAALYDDFVRMEALCRDYLAMIGIDIVHNSALNYIVCYPPGADIPTKEHCAEIDAVPKLTRSLSIEEKLMMICLRLGFEEQLSEGKIDEKGRAFVTLEQISYSFESLGKRPLPLGAELQQLLQPFKNLRIIGVEDNQDIDSFVIINNTILAFTLSSVIEAVKNNTTAELV